MELKLGQDYSNADLYNTELTGRMNQAGMTMADSLCKRFDSLYHLSDTLFTLNFREYCLDMMDDHGMGGNGMMNGGMGNQNGGMNCNMDSIFGVMNGMMNLTTFKMDSMMSVHMENCSSMGTMSSTMQDNLGKMQSLRKSHMAFHN